MEFGGKSRYYIGCRRQSVNMVVETHQLEDGDPLDQTVRADFAREMEWSGHGQLDLGPTIKFSKRGVKYYEISRSQNEGGILLGKECCFSLPVHFEVIVKIWRVLYIGGVCDQVCIVSQQAVNYAFDYVWTENSGAFKVMKTDREEEVHENLQIIVDNI